MIDKFLTPKVAKEVLKKYQRWQKRVLDRIVKEGYKRYISSGLWFVSPIAIDDLRQPSISDVYKGEMKFYISPILRIIFEEGCKEFGVGCVKEDFVVLTKDDIIGGAVIITNNASTRTVGLTNITELAAVRLANKFFDVAVKLAEPLLSITLTFLRRSYPLEGATIEYHDIVFTPMVELMATSEDWRLVINPFTFLIAAVLSKNMVLSLMWMLRHEAFHQILDDFDPYIKRFVKNAPKEFLQDPNRHMFINIGADDVINNHLLNKVNDVAFAFLDMTSRNVWVKHPAVTEGEEERLFSYVDLALEIATQYGVSSQMMQEYASVRQKKNGIAIGIWLWKKNRQKQLEVPKFQNLEEKYKKAVKEAGKKKKFKEKVVYKSQKRKGLPKDRKVIKGAIKREAIQRGFSTESGDILEEFIKYDFFKVKIGWKRKVLKFIKTVAQRSVEQTWSSLDLVGMMLDKKFPESIKMPVNGELIVIVDTSGSIDDKEFKMFINYIWNLGKQLRLQRMKLVLADTDITAVYELKHITKTEIERKVRFLGRTGTTFDTVLKQLEERFKKINGVVYFTDGVGRYPDKTSYPVLWVTVDVLPPENPNWDSVKLEVK